MIKIRNLNFSYSKKQQVLYNIKMDIEDKGIVGILGHNGAGKTTFLKCIAGLLNHYSGNITKDEKIQISYMPDSNGFYPLLTPLQNLEFRSSLNFKDKSKTNQIAKYWLDKLKLENISKAGTLSQGMQKRLSLACTLVGDTKIILLDEPTNGLDPISMDTVIRVLKELENSGKMILINTHDLNLVKEICYKVFVLQKGKLIKEDLVSDIKDNLREYYKNTVNRDLERK